MTTTSPERNPLLEQGTLPDFSLIEPKHVLPAVREAIRLGRAGLAGLEQVTDPTWQNFVLPLRALSRRLDRVWGVVGHLMGVRNSEGLRAAHEEAEPEIVQFRLELGQSQTVYRLWQKLVQKAETELTTPARKRIAESALRDAKLSGVGLEGVKRERFNEIQRRLAALSTQFSNAVLDSTKAFRLLLRSADEVAGLPDSWRQMAAQAARTSGENAATAERGPWLVTLDFPSYYPFLQHAQNRPLREQVYRASVTRASGTGFAKEWNNWPLIDEILKLRREEAEILGFGNFAQVSLAGKMAPDTARIRAMITDLFRVARPAATKEISELESYAKTKGLAGHLQLWDIAFYSERRREELYSYTDEELKPYFPLPRVLSGLFALAEQLFGITVRPAVQMPPLWHSDVQFFEVYRGERQIAAFYLDPYARSGEKRGGAWMDVCRQREETAGQTVLPVAYLVCNGTPPVLGAAEGPVGGTPSLMTFGEVETLFHEFGHGLQHMLTTIAEYEASGISNVEWDAVELPSQFMENWVYERSVMDRISGHWQTGEVLPNALFEKIIAAKNYMAASQMLRQLYFSLLDIELHEKYDGTESVRDIQRRIAADYTVIAPLPDDAFLCSFSHIFAGGYAAGYYSYKWAEVLSADAFAAFEEAGLNNAEALQQLGTRYRDTVLSLGGSRHPLEVYREFRGRDATIDALLRHNGLSGAA
ncbi:MAG: M3 family metallopeptidase [Spirochaetota bacterium]